MNSNNSIKSLGQIQMIAMPLITICGICIAENTEGFG